MSHKHTSQRFHRERTSHPQRPLGHAVLRTRRALSRMSWLDAGAVILIWGNLIGLIAYPNLIHAAKPPVVATHQIVSK